MALSDIWAAARWWAALTVLGLAAWPLIFTLLRRLPDRGFAFARPAGLLLAGYFFWLAGSLGLAGNDGGGLVLALLIVAGLSWLAYRRRPAPGPSLGGWLRANKRAVVVTELLFLAVFALWVWVRAQNPAISATEKPMEFAFLNGVGRSPSFPPLDPWLSGYAISYYYFGYVMVSLLGRMAFVAEPLAFNLAIAWLVAGTAVGAFGVVVNLVSLRQNPPREAQDGPPGPASAASRFISSRALLFGVIAALAVPIAGNMQMGLELLHGNGVGSDALWAWLDVRDIDGPASMATPARYQTSNWWWWRTSRVIHEYRLSGQVEEGLEPIVEIPSFSFVLGDMHPHVLALPFALLSIAVALAWLLESGMTNDESRTTNERSEPVTRCSSVITNLMGVSPALFLFTALVLGGLSFLNTWDVAIHLFLIVGAWFVAGWFRRGTAEGLWSRAALVGAALVAAAVLLYLPFYLGFRSQAGPPFLLPFLMRPTRLVQFLIIFGLPLLAIAVFLLTLAARQRFRHWRTGVGVAAALVIGLLIVMLAFVWLVAAGPENRIGGLLNELGLTLPPRPDSPLALGWGLRATIALLPALLGARLASPWLTLALAGLIALVVMVWRARVDEAAARKPSGASRFEPATPFVLLLILTGALLTLGPEFLYLRDNFGVRLNTTFKFYYQAWVMFGVAAVYGLDYLLATHRSAVSRAVSLATATVYVVLLAVALLFPVYAVRSRAVEYRGPKQDLAGAPLERQPATLDGLAYVRRYNPSEYEAIQWLRQQAVGAAVPPVLLEAVGGQYSGYGRISADTGLPTVLGWPGHEWQWRGSDHPEPGRRQPIVEQIYTAPDLSAVAALLDEFNIAFIYVGDLEREKYGPVGLDKFADQLPVAFANDRVTIYRWQAAQ